MTELAVNASAVPGRNESEAAATRLHYLDAARGILMLLGVVLHSAVIFHPSSPWLVKSAHTSATAGAIAETIHLFRMPAFFLISGYLSYLTLKLKGTAYFLNSRLLRVLVPLLAVGFTFNLVQAYVVKSASHEVFSVVQTIQSGEWVSHLWFLVNLIAYFMALLAFHWFWTRVAQGRRDRFMSIVWRADPRGLILLGCGWGVALAALDKMGVPVYSKLVGFVEAYSLLHYAPFFFFGAYLTSRRDLLGRLLSTNALAMAVLLALAVALQSYLDGAARTRWITAGRIYVDDLASWLSAILVLWLFYKMIRRDSKIVTYLSNSSYSIYLFHHLLVVLFGLAIVDMHWHWFPSVLLICLAAYACSALIHALLISRYRVLRLLFNGR